MHVTVWMRRRVCLGMLVMALPLAGCSLLPSPAPATSTPVPATPTPTPVPLAATVNGEPITLQAWQAEVARFEAAQHDLGIDLATVGDYGQQVLQSLIDRKLLAQGARALGVTIDPATATERKDALATDMGGAENLQAWLTSNGYTLESFLQDLTEELMATAMIESIAGQVPQSETQVHARHILVHTQDEATYLRQQIAAGADFATLALNNSLDLSTATAGGDLGWFASGMLTTPEVEEAAFSLQAGETSEVIQSQLGFHIVQCLERGERPLSWETLQARRVQAVEAWLTLQRQSAVIEILAH